MLSRIPSTKLPAAVAPNTPGHGTAEIPVAELKPYSRADARDGKDRPVPNRTHDVFNGLLLRKGEGEETTWVLAVDEMLIRDRDIALFGRSHPHALRTAWLVVRFAKGVEPPPPGSTALHGTIVLNQDGEDGALYASLEGAHQGRLPDTESCVLF